MRLSRPACAPHAESATLPRVQGDGDRREASPAASTLPTGEERVEQMRSVLTRAVAKACPAYLLPIRDDLVQSAILRVLERERLGVETAPRSASYLWRVAFSVVVDEARRLGRRQPVRGEQPDDEPRTSSRPDLGMAIRACLRELIEPRQLAVILHLQGYASEEASGVLGWKLKRVRNLIFRGMADLRRCLSAKGFS